MRNLFSVAIFALISGTCASYGAEKDQMPWNANLNTPPAGKFSPMTAEALQRELPDDRFASANRFPPTRLVSDGTQEPEPTSGVSYTIVRVVKVTPLTGQRVLEAYAKDAPNGSDTLSSTPMVHEEFKLADYRLLFDQRRVKEWER